MNSVLTIPFSIPTHYVPVYENLLKRMAMLGRDLIKDCNALCDNKVSNPSKCWTMFQTACAAYNDTQYKQADFVINYIIDELQLGLDHVSTTVTDNVIYYGTVDNIASINLSSASTFEYVTGLDLTFTYNKVVVFIAVPEAMSINYIAIDSVFKTNIVNDFVCFRTTKDNKRYVIYYYQFATAASNNITTKFSEEAISEGTKLYYGATDVYDPISIDLSTLSTVDISEIETITKTITTATSMANALFIVPETIKVNSLSYNSTNVYTFATIPPIAPQNTWNNIATNLYIRKKYIGDYAYTYWRYDNTGINKSTIISLTKL